MKTSNLKKSGQKIIGQILFRPSLDFLCNAPMIAKGLEKKFKEWRVEGENITLYSPEDAKLMQIFPDKLTYLNESNENFEELYSYSENIYAKITEHSINEIRRIGVRNTIILETPIDFPELVELMFKKFFPKDEEFTKISGNKARDVAFVLDSERNGFLNHIRIGPVTKQEAPKHFNSNFERELDIEKDGNIFIDIDVFVNEKLTKENALEKLKGAIEENKTLINEYLDYLVA